MLGAAVSEFMGLIIEVGQRGRHSRWERPQRKRGTPHRPISFAGHMPRGLCWPWSSLHPRRQKACLPLQVAVDVVQQDELFGFSYRVRFLFARQQIGWSRSHQWQVQVIWLMFSAVITKIGSTHSCESNWMTHSSKFVFWSWLASIVYCHPQ